MPGDERMDLDRTFCTGLRCDRKESCERWSLNLEKWAKENGVDLSTRWLSIGSFCDADGQCDFYVSQEK